jgi:arabinosaccharide transport system permease protein
MSGTRHLNSQRWVPYVFMLPFIVSILAFYLYPVIGTVVMSFQEILPGETRFIGVENYRDLLNEDFYRALSVSFAYTVLTIAILIPLPIVFAVMLNGGLRKLNAVYRAVFFIPSLVSVVVAGTIFRLIFAGSPRSALNTVLAALGFPVTDWILGGAAQAMFLMVMLAVWRWTGVNIVYFMAGLQTIPGELYEAAEMDGAGVWYRFFRITVPLLKPTIVFVTTISIFGGFAMFEESYIFWQGNSPNNVGLTIVGLIYRRGFQLADMGLASAIGLVLMAIVLVFSFTELRLTGYFKQEA